jgi:putative oxidoreductase
MSAFHTQDPAVLAIGLFAVRLILGLGLAAHGAQKLFGWFGGYGLEGTGDFFESLGFRPGRAFAALAGLGELGGGLLTAAGFLGPIGPAIMILVMLVAILAVHRPNGFFASNNGIELPLLFATGALAVAVAGPGVISLDALFGLEALWAPAVVWISLAAAVVLALGNVGMRGTSADAGHGAEA